MGNWVILTWKIFEIVQRHLDQGHTQWWNIEVTSYLSIKRLGLIPGTENTSKRKKKGLGMWLSS